MSDFMTAPLSELKNRLIEDGRISRGEVEQMRKRLLEDHIIDRYEAEFIFAVNDAVKDGSNASGFDDFFVDAITAHVIDTGLHPGILHEDEWFWLEEKLMKDFDVGESETRLLKNILEKAQSVPPGFREYIRDLEATADNHDGGSEDQSIIGRLMRKLLG